VSTYGSVYSRAPLRLSFVGGGTDTDAFAFRYGGCVVSATIARYVRVKMKPGRREYASYPLAQSDTSFLERLARRFPPVSLELRVDVPPRSGLGASGAIGVAVLGALNTLLQDEPLNPAEIINQAHRVETDELGIAGGRQDQIAALYGGLNYIEFGESRFNRTPIEVKPETLLRLEESLVMVFVSSRKAHSGAPMEDELHRIRERDPEAISALLKQKELANEGRKYLRRGDVASFAEVVDEAWKAKKKQTPLTTTGFIDEVYDAGKRAGAIGGKISGAGGGGYFYFIAPDRAGPVGEAMIKLGLKPESVTFTLGGLRVWK